MEAGFAQHLLEYSPDALLLVGPDGSISFLNTAAEQLFGYPRAQLLGADHSLLLAEASREDFHGVLAGLGTAAGPRLPFAGSGRRADGTELPVEITCSLVPAPAGAADAGTSVALSVRGAGHRNGHPDGQRNADQNGHQPLQPQVRPAGAGHDAGAHLGPAAPAAPAVPSAVTSTAVVLPVLRELPVRRVPLPRRSPGTTTSSRPGPSATP